MPPYYHGVFIRSTMSDENTTVGNVKVFGRKKKPTFHFLSPSPSPTLNTKLRRRGFVNGEGASDDKDNFLGKKLSGPKLLTKIAGVFSVAIAFVSPYIFLDDHLRNTVDSLQSRVSLQTV